MDIILQSKIEYVAKMARIKNTIAQGMIYLGLAGILGGIVSCGYNLFDSKNKIPESLKPARELEKVVSCMTDVYAPGLPLSGNSLDKYTLEEGIYRLNHYSDNKKYSAEYNDIAKGVISRLINSYEDIQINPKLGQEYFMWKKEQEKDNRNSKGFALGGTLLVAVGVSILGLSITKERDSNFKH